MPSHSALARLQQGLVAALFAGALAWLVARWNASVVVALAGFFAILFVHVFFLAVEFACIPLVSRGDPAPRPSLAQLAHAWLGEAVMSTRVFGWRQPFRWRAVPDRLASPSVPARRGVVFVHGFVCNRGFWTPWMHALSVQQRSFVAVNLEPVFGRIDSYVPIIEAAVHRVRDASGLAPVLVCHSMGGLAARAWLRATVDPLAVHHVVTIGSPHHGTWLARYSRMLNGIQMRRQGEWLGKLAPSEARTGYGRFTCWYSNCDNIVLPPSTATLEGADNRLVEGVAHVDLAFHPRVMAETLALLEH